MRPRMKTKPQPRMTMNFSDYRRYSLEKYNGLQSRHTCPSCGGKRCFTLYVDEAGRPLADNVGRCDHESSCGYHYTPKDYFAAHPSEVRWSDGKSNGGAVHRTKTPPVAKAIDTIPDDVVRRTVRADIQSDFVKFLYTLFGASTVARLVSDYQIGVTKARDVVFYQIDIAGRVRTGKVMKYDPETGHRVKDADGNGRFDWVHALMKRSGQLPSEWTLTQCLFGEHLLKRFPSKDVRIVEAEKTAIICAGFMPQFVWMATGGKSQLNARVDVLRGRRVTLFPDVDGYTLWKEKAAERRDLCLTVSDYLERRATDEDRRNKIDIADILVRWRRSQSTATDADAQSEDDYSDIDSATVEALRRCVGSEQMQQAVDLIRDFGLIAVSVPLHSRSRFYNRMK